MNNLLRLLRQVRAFVFRNIRPAPDISDLKPMSRKFGFDRGKPIDRVYIEKFLKRNTKSIRGNVLEINTDAYTKKYGAEKVTNIDILDIDSNNKSATIIGDLRDLSSIKDNTYDSLLITQTFGVIDEYQKAVLECHRILKPGGVLLATVSAMAPLHQRSSSYWRFNPLGAKYAFSKVFGANNVTISEFGNFHTGLAFWMGMAAEDIDEKVFDKKDPEYPFILGIKAIKK